MNKTKNQVIELAERLKADTIKWRRHLHSIPERSFEEHETAKFVAGILESIGYKVRTGVAGTGVVAEIGSGPTVAIRAELDGLMIGERNYFEYASKNPIMMHACGHDANMATVLACASILKAIAPKGCVRIIMQPASEIAADDKLKSGAVKMIEEGVLDDVIAIIGMHVDSTIRNGQVGIIAEPVVAQTELFNITIGRPEVEDRNAEISNADQSPHCFDPVDVGARIVSAIYEETRSLAQDLALQPVTVINLERLDQDGSSLQGRLSGRVKSNSKQMFNTIAEKIKAACAQQSKNCQYSLDFETNKTDASMSPFVVDLIKQASTLIVGEENVVVLKRKTWAEDFSAYSAAKPGAMFLLGTRTPGPPRSHHSDTFDIDETYLHLGAAILAQGAICVLASTDRSN